MLVLTLNREQYFTINDDIVIRVNDIKTNRCMIGITAGPEVKITRGTLLERERRDGGKAASVPGKAPRR